MNILFALIVASVAVICAGDEIAKMDVPVASQEAPIVEKPSNSGPAISVKGDSSPEKVDDLLKSVKQGDRANQMLNNDQTQKLEVAFDGSDLKNLPIKKIDLKEAEEVDPEAYLKKSKKDKQNSQGSNKSELSQVVNDFINKVFKAPVELFNTIKDAIKDLTTRIQNSLPQPSGP